MLTCGRVLTASLKVQRALNAASRCYYQYTLLVRPPVGVYASHLATLRCQLRHYRTFDHQRPKDECAVPNTALGDQLLHNAISNRPNSDLPKQSRLSIDRQPYQPDLASILDPFLPPELRLGPEENKAIRPAQELPSVLCKYRQASSDGLLQTLLSGNGRWASFRYLVKSLAELEPPKQISNDRSLQSLQQTPWSNQNEATTALARRTEELINLKRDRISNPITPKLEVATELSHASSVTEDFTNQHSAMGEIWLNLGRVVIQASASEPTKSKRLMDNVYGVIAHLHSHNHIPSSIYGYDSDDIPVERRKPPYLHVMSARMMTTLTDAEWRLQEHEMSGMFDFNRGEADPNMSTISAIYGGPDIRPLPPSLWLEFILWCCHANGHLLESGSLVGQVLSSSMATNWTAIPWNDVLRLQTDHHKRHQSWFDKVASLVEGYSGEKPLIEMPSHSISSEVVQVIANGLLAHAHESSTTRRISNAVLNGALHSMALSGDSAKTLKINGMLSHVANMASINADALAKLYSHADASKKFQAAPHSSAAEDDDQGSEPFSFYFAQDSTNILQASLITALDAHTAEGMIAEAEETFQRLQGLQQRETAAISEDEKIVVNIPSSVVSQYLDLAMRTGHTETAKSLLYTSGLINDSALTQEVYQPIVLRAALAFSDNSLLRRVLFNFSIQMDLLSNDTLEALIEAQIRTDKLAGNPQILRILSQDRNAAPSPRITMLHAAKILQTSHDWHQAVHRGQTPQQDRTVQDQIHRAPVHLRMILGRIYIPRQVASAIPDYTAHREITQLARILASAGGELSTIAAPFAEVGNAQLSSPVAIPAHAFNVLLEAISRTEGWKAARRLFERWCNFDKWESETLTVDGLPVQKPRFGAGDGVERVVEPDVASVKAVLAEFDHDLRAYNRMLALRKTMGAEQTKEQPRLVKWPNDQSKEKWEWDTASLPEQAVWALEQYRRMKLGGEEIDALLPGLRPLGGAKSSAWELLSRYPSKK